MKALIVDDSSVMRQIIARGLKQAGFTEIKEAGDGEEGLALAMGITFDLVLMDWNMPKMTGIEAVCGIRAKGNKVPILMVTTEAEKSRVLEALKSGASNYLVKPFKEDALLDKVRQVLKA